MSSTCRRSTSVSTTQHLSGSANGSIGLTQRADLDPRSSQEVIPLTPAPSPAGAFDASPDPGAVMRAVRVSVVIPTLNEAENLPLIHQRLPSHLHELIIVDGHSIDRTVEVARRLWPDAILINQDGKGKGNALACGFAAATGDIIVMLDADGSTDPAEVPRFVASLLCGADFAKGTRFVTGGGSTDITFTRRLGNRVLSGAVNLLWNCDYSDLCYGYNAFWRRHLRVVNPDCSGFEVETLINIRAARSRLNVVEVPSFEANRQHGVGSLRATRDGMRVLRTILAERLRPV
jgi:glycosyltransferase involved in cell wall biosynthesis